VNIIQKDNTDVKINFYMGINDEKKKVTKIRRIEDSIFYLSLEALYYQGGYIV
jgi:hypothetical protein